MSGGLATRLVVARDTGFTLDAELAISPGRTVALLGPNGAGKSTAVAAIAGLLPLDDGYVRLGDKALDEPREGQFVPAEDRNIGVVFQDYVLFPHLSVLDNIAFGLRSRGVGRHAAAESSRDWADRLGLAGLHARKPVDLSGGQAQRVALARALATHPELLLLDEPLAALDVTTRAQLRRDLIDHLSGFAGPRLVITHDPAEAFLLADEIHVIEAGAITQVGSTDEIRLRPRTKYIADLAGSNLFSGVAANGTVAVGAHTLTIADTHAAGDVLATINPRAISIHRHRPEGSPRNAWQTTIVRIEHHGDRVRLQTGSPLPLTAELTPVAVADLALRIDEPIWLSVKATEVGVDAD
ncbi:MAG: ABC transporter ATP-binding protein [bacterium]|nr:ABC transporter ATP-binding protein [bacterium]